MIYFSVLGSCDVLGKSVSKLSVINLNIKTCALLLITLIDFFSFPNWLLGNNRKEDNLPASALQFSNSLNAVPAKLAKERARLNTHGLITQSECTIWCSALPAGIRAASEIEWGLISLWGGSRLQVDAHMHKPQLCRAQRLETSLRPRPSAAASSRAPLNQIITEVPE